MSEYESDAEYEASQDAKQADHEDRAIRPDPITHDPIVKASMRSVAHVGRRLHWRVVCSCGYSSAWHPREQATATRYNQHLSIT